MRQLVSRHLENFLAMHEARNMRRAAERRGVTQPALTRSLRLLEAELGVELFARTAQGLEPTAAGDALARHARAVEQEARFGAMAARAAQEGMRGLLRIGVGQVLAVSTFPAAAVRLHAEFPGLELTVTTGITSELVAQLTDGLLDCVAAASPGTPLPDGFAGVPLTTTRMIVVARRDHPLRDRACAEGPVGIADVARHARVGFVGDREFDLRSRPSMGRYAERLRPVVQTASPTIMFGILAATDHIAIVSDLLLPRARREGLDRIDTREALWDLDVALMARRTVIGAKPLAVLQGALARTRSHVAFESSR